jgi:hypothetical protein
VLGIDALPVLEVEYGVDVVFDGEEVFEVEAYVWVLG